MNPVCEPGQVYASTNPRDVANGRNQQRRVLAVEDDTRTRWNPLTHSFEPRNVRRAVLTCDGNGGKMRSRVTLRLDGSLPRHVLVAEPDPRIRALAEVFRGIATREPYGYKDTLAARYPTRAEDYQPDVRDLADEVYDALLWPRRPDGTQNARIEVVLHQDALVALAERLLTLVQTVEQSALVADFTSPYERPAALDPSHDPHEFGGLVHPEDTGETYNVMEP